jgi:hypothetical protein
MCWIRVGRTAVRRCLYARNLYAAGMYNCVLLMVWSWTVGETACGVRFLVQRLGWGGSNGKKFWQVRKIVMMKRSLHTQIEWVRVKLP